MACKEGYCWKAPPSQLFVSCIIIIIVNIHYSTLVVGVTNYRKLFLALPCSPNGQLTDMISTFGRFLFITMKQYSAQKHRQTNA